MATTKKAPKAKKDTKVKDLAPKAVKAVRGGSQPPNESKIRTY